MDPEIAVVIPTHRREVRLAFALEALEAQTLDKSRFEVIVVRGDSPGPRAGTPDGLNVRFLDHKPDSGPAEKRNRGWRATTAPLIAFTDDDTRVSPDWLATLREAAARHGDAAFVIQGPTQPDPDEARLRHGLAKTVEVSAPSRWFESCNIAYPRELLEQLDGFDERFYAAGEDTDLGLRALAEGAQPVWCPEALVWHAVHSRHIWAALRDARAWKTVALVFKRHPSQRREIRFGLFLRPAHARLALALGGVGMTLATRRLTPAAAAAPYMRRHLLAYARTPRGVARALLDLLPRALFDLVEMGATARSGMRYRVVLL